MLSHLLKLRFNSTFSLVNYSLYLPIVVQATILRWAFFCFCDGLASCILIFFSWWICDDLQLIYFGGGSIWVFLNKIWAGCGSVCLFGHWLLMMWPFGVVLLTYVSTRMLFALCCTIVLYTQPLAQECFLHFHRHIDIDTLDYYLESYFLDHLGFSRFYHKGSLILYLVGETSFARIRWIFGILFHYVWCRLSRGNEIGELLSI